MKNVVILGASGFVGYELYNLCKSHPNINLSALDDEIKDTHTLQFEINANG